MLSFNAKMFAMKIKFFIFLLCFSLINGKILFVFIVVSGRAFAV